MVQYLVKEVNQFPSDIECMRYIATIADKVSVDDRVLMISSSTDRGENDLAEL